MSKTVSILGCGWLGLPLAQSLVRLNFKVKGSTTTPGKIPALKAAGISPYLLKSDPQLSCPDLKEFFACEILFVTIPFKRSLSDPVFYKEQIEAVISEVRNSPVELVIFSSSTSVYPPHSGIVTEEDAAAHDPRAGILLGIENMLIHQDRFAATVIRFGGLYGYDRKIGSARMRGTAPLTGGASPVNLIHLDDCVGIVSEIIRQDARGEIFNACSDRHPTRRELYALLARRSGEAPPVFADGKEEGTKIVSSEKAKRRLKYAFKYPDPMAQISEGNR